MESIPIFRLVSENLKPIVIPKTQKSILIFKPKSQIRIPIWVALRATNIPANLPLAISELIIPSMHYVE